MGVLETKRVIQPPKRRRMTKRRRTIELCAKIMGIVAGVIAVGTIVYIVGFARYTYVNLSELTTAEVSGYDGHGTLSTNTTSMAGLEDFFDTVDVDIMETEDTVNGQLSNGDRLEISYIYNRELAKNLGLRVRGGSEFITIKNLPESTHVSYDELFSGVSLSYEGVAPLVTASVENVSDKEPIKDVVYTIVDPKEYYDEGDVIRVEATFNEDAALANAYEIEAGPEGYVKDFTVTGVDSYLTSADELPQELLDEMKAYGATLFGTEPGDANEFGLRVFTAAGAMYTTSDGEYTFAWRTPSYISSYFSCINEEHLGEPGQQINDVKIVYDTSIVQSDGKAVSAEAVVVFKDVIRKADGSVEVNYDGAKIVSASTKDSDIKELVRANNDMNYTSTKLEQQ